MGALDKFKRDLTKHRGRAMVLGMLFVTMVGMSIRAALELRPRQAGASEAVPLSAEHIKEARTEVGGAEAQARIDESKRLWSALKKVSPTGADSKATFTFDSAYYPTPAPIVDLSKPVDVGPALPEVKPNPGPVIDETALHVSQIREQGRALIVKSTAVGNGTTEPMAIVNQKLVTVGQKILGFEVTAIRSREVDFVKEGVTIVGKMPDGQ